MIHLFLHDNNLTDNTLSFVSANRMFLQKYFNIFIVFITLFHVILTTFSVGMFSSFLFFHHCDNSTTLIRDARYSRRQPVLLASGMLQLR